MLELKNKITINEEVIITIGLNMNDNNTVIDMTIGQIQLFHIQYLSMINCGLESIQNTTLALPTSPKISI